MSKLKNRPSLSMASPPSSRGSATNGDQDEKLGKEKKTESESHSEALASEESGNNSREDGL